MVVIPLQPALVSARALSTTSRRTVSTSRLSQMRRLASLSFERRSRNAWMSPPGSSDVVNSTPSIRWRPARAAVVVPMQPPEPEHRLCWDGERMVTDN